MSVFTNELFMKMSAKHLRMGGEFSPEMFIYMLRVLQLKYAMNNALNVHRRLRYSAAKLSGFQPEVASLKWHEKVVISKAP